MATRLQLLTFNCVVNRYQITMLKYWFNCTMKDEGAKHRNASQYYVVPDILVVYALSTCTYR